MNFSMKLLLIKAYTGVFKKLTIIKLKCPRKLGNYVKVFKKTSD